jgi:hypothetical protein
VHSVNLPDGSLVQYDSTAGTGSDVDEADRPRAWWFAKDQPGKEGEKRYEGLEETWALLKDTLEKEKYDVVLGFSQGERDKLRLLGGLYYRAPLGVEAELVTVFTSAGAALAGALASRLTLPESGINHPPFRLAILVSGLLVTDAAYRLVENDDLSPDISPYPSSAQCPIRETHASCQAQADRPRKRYT